MNFDFPTFLVAATAVTGGIWLLDALLWAPKRRRLAVSGDAGQSTNAGTDAGQGAGMGGAPADATRRQAKEPVLVEYAKSFFPVILAVLVLRSFVVEPFRIPSGSMMPTLLVGDFILVNKFSYGLRWPVLNSKFLELGEPQRGDVVVFRFPQDESVDYIKRVIGVPGDVVYYSDKHVIINGERVETMPLGTYQGVGSGKRLTGESLALENLDGVKHDILFNPLVPDLPPGCRILAQGPVQIPEGYYFVMGDNRDNSNDSRCWGLVPEANLVGKAFAIWMSWDGKRSGLPIAFGRIGDVIH
ncbi:MULTISPECIES: signal peptidase I [Thiorhodovibrio]|uniref:signal peptidase I n=1 Tax=Thiorhodovibrio TaxID=61593 RepID=UPI00191219E6|nr:MULTISPECIES: signal peptidase I [Thiorhodovibrio]MBK5970560.1 signal peptidase I [Thiorhodovibrio winogradskyi]WPL12814.1 Signal peptidase I [Thiorhodovibrio litoralis]